MPSEIEQEKIYQKIQQLQRELNSLSVVKQREFNYPGKTPRQIEYFTRNKKFQLKRTGQQLENFTVFNRKIESNQRLIEKLKDVLDYDYYVFKRQYKNLQKQTKSSGLISQDFNINVLNFGQWHLGDSSEIIGEQQAISYIGADSRVTTLTNESLIKNLSKYIDEQTREFQKTYEQILVQVVLTISLIKKENSNIIDRTQYTTTKLLKNTFQVEDITEVIEGIKNNDSEILVSQVRVDKVQYFPISNIDRRLTFQQLRAFNPSSQQKFHDITFKSTSNNKICIFETFVIIHNIFSAYNKKQIKQEFLKLDKELQHLIKNGNVEKSVQGLQKYYETQKEDFVVMYKIYGEIQAVQVQIDNFNIINYEDIKQEKMCFLYNNEHVAPYKYDKEHFIYQLELKQQKKYSLKPAKYYGKSNKIKKYWSYDCETRKVNQQSVVFEIHLTDCDKGSKCDNKCQNKHLDFYGDESINKFVDYITDNLMIRTKISKKNKKEQITYHNIFGHNNARFDNLLIFSQILDKVGIFNQKSVIDGNTIKTLKFFNIKFFDLCLFYTFKLQKLAEQFKLEDNKMKYPYNFADLNYLQYKGDIPDLMFWNNANAREQYIKENGNQFDMEKYTKEYCKRDCQLTLQIAKLHLQRCKGEMNGKKFDVSEKQTAASLSLELFQQCFLKDWVFESPQDIEKIERDLYHGGRNEVFKKKFTEQQQLLLFYIDINSSYPSSMTKIMPFKFKKHYILNKSMKITEENQIVDYYMYECTYEYKENDRFYIPNILQKDKKGKTIIRKKSEEKIKVWGCELKEAFLSGCECEVFSVYEYQGKNLFKEYIEEIYGQRLTAKKDGNAVIVEFCKLLMNSLYGKMGQGLKTKTMIVNHINEFFSKVGNKIMVKEILELGENRLLVKYKDEKDENKHIGKLVRFASYITAESRTTLSRGMRFVGYENVYYCDTDSIFFQCEQKKFDDEISKKICHPTELGKFKLEKKIKEAYFCAPKVYWYDDPNVILEKKPNFAMKGIRTNDIISKNQGDQKQIKQNFIDIVEGKKIVYLNETMFKRSIIDGVKIIPQKRTIKAVLNKREWQDNESFAF